MRTADLDYDLPPGRIALTPAERRDDARLMVVSRSDDSVLEHRRVADLPELLRRGDLLVLNQSKVVPARLEGVRADTGGRVEGLVLGREGVSEDGERWTVMLRAKRLRPGIEITLHDEHGAMGASLTLIEKDAGEAGAWRVRVGKLVGPGRALDAVGRTPLPPYILKSRRDAGVELPDRVDRERYQTVFASAGSEGSVAAPTAGLHFTAELFERLAARGVERASVVLHVGTGTFRPVETATVEEHPMHGEWCELPQAAGRAVLGARHAGGRVIAVGTTSARTLESFASMDVAPGGERLETRLLVTPGYRWRWVDGMLTNFHLPRSTLLAMVAALFPGGVERVKALYRAAIAEEYRFYSYGDAMLVLP